MAYLLKNNHLIIITVILKKGKHVFRTDKFFRHVP